MSFFPTRIQVAQINWFRNHTIRPSLTCMAGNYMYLSYMSQMRTSSLQIAHQDGCKIWVAPGRGRIYVVNVQLIGFLIFVLDWRDFFAEFSLDTGEKLGKFERCLFFYMSFFVFAFRSKFWIYLVFHSCFGFNAYFMWNFPAKLKKKLDLFQKVSKKSPNFFLILLEPRSL